MKKTFFKGIGFGALTAALFTLMVFITISCEKEDPIIPEMTEVNPGDIYEGGIVVYVLGPGDPGYDPLVPHGLIYSEGDLENQYGVSTFAWGTKGLLTNAISPDSGYTNTIDIIAVESTGGTVSWYAAQMCDDYSVTVSGVTYNDWYLPSHNELSSMGLGYSVARWSSTEIQGSATQATVVPRLDFDHQKDKDNEYKVRAVRKF